LVLRFQRKRFKCGLLSKENLFLPLVNTNFISKFEINAFEINPGKGTRHFNPLEGYRFSHHWFSGVKTPLLVYKYIQNNGICTRYSTIETKEVARIGYNRFLFPHD
jgi:hypothetical protein